MQKSRPLYGSPLREIMAIITGRRKLWMHEAEEKTGGLLRVSPDEDFHFLIVYVSAIGRNTGRLAFMIVIKVGS